MGNAKKNRKLKKQQEAERKKAAKQQRQQNPGGGGTYASKRRKREHEPAVEQNNPSQRSSDVADEFMHRLHSGRPSSIADIRGDDRPDWEIARAETGDKASRFHPPRAARAEEREIDEGLFQTEVYFVDNRARVQLKIGYDEVYDIAPHNPDRKGHRATSLVARKIGEVENLKKSWSFDPDTIPAWEIVRHVGVDVKISENAEIVVDEVIASEDELKRGLVDWCRNRPSLGIANQQGWPTAQKITRHGLG